MSSRPPVPPLWPATGIASLETSASVVLRDVAVRGQVALTRPRTTASRAAANEALRPGTLASVPEPVAAHGHLAAAEPIAPPARADAETLRRGYMEGLAQGRAEAAEEARQVLTHADQALKRKQQALELQIQQQLQEQRQKDQAALQSRQQRIDALLAALPAQIQARIDAAEDDLVALCFESVCRILGAAGATPEGIRAQVAQAREGLQGRPLAAVHLHPDDLAMLGAASGSEDPALQWVADPAVAVGGCILQSPQGGLDARLETQLRTLTELLTQARAAARDAAAARGR